MERKKRQDGAHKNNPGGYFSERAGWRKDKKEQFLPVPDQAGFSQLKRFIRVH